MRQREPASQPQNSPPIKKLWERGSLAVTAFRVLALGIGSVQLMLFQPDSISLVPRYVLVGALSLYTAATSVTTLWLKPKDTISYLTLAIDVCLSSIPAALTGATHSPFLAYALTPILASSLYLRRSMTIAVALVSTALLFGSQSAIPAYSNHFTLTEIKDISFFLIAAALTTSLPYLINVRVKEQWRYRDIVEERQRLSHELHDGPVQTVAALRWQVQTLRHRFEGMGLDVRELNEVEKLAELGQQETRDSLEMLRSSFGDGHFIERINEFVARLQSRSSIVFDLHVDSNSLRMDPLVEVELLHICQEALSNATRHSGASEVQVTVGRIGDRIEAEISDDGRGMNMEALPASRGHGLAVMQERAYAIGGTFNITSSPNLGTQIVVEVPATARSPRTARIRERTLRVTQHAEQATAARQWDGISGF